LLPDNAKEGSILNIVVDEAATNDKLQKVTERMNKLFKD
jgi:TusA-related sulfurtransferase